MFWSNTKSPTAILAHISPDLWHNIALAVCFGDIKQNTFFANNAFSDLVPELKQSSAISAFPAFWQNILAIKQNDIHDIIINHKYYRLNIHWVGDYFFICLSPEPDFSQYNLIGETPVWLRDEQENLIFYHNPYHTKARKNEPSLLLQAEEKLSQLARQAHQPQTTKLQKTIMGQRKTFELISHPLFDNTTKTFQGVFSVAIDRTEEITLNKQLQTQQKAHQDVLEQLSTAIAILNADQTLLTYNHSFAQLWELEEAWLNNHPRYLDVLDKLRHKRKLPEVADFSQFKNSEIKLLTSLINQQEDFWHLPNNVSIRRRVVPYALGGVLFIYEDVSTTLALERSYNTLVEVERETVNSLYEGVMAVGSNGRLKLINPSCLQIWGIPQDAFGEEPHIKELYPYFAKQFAHTTDWENFQKKLLIAISEREIEEGNLHCNEDMVIDFSSMPLPDGNTLLSFLDISDSFKVEKALTERNEALETADRLKTEFLANISYELRTPLNTIVGFSEMLNAGYLGEMNDKQKTYLEAILASSTYLTNLINDILDLALFEAGRLTLEKKEFDIFTALQSVVLLNRESARENEQILMLSATPEIGTYFGDEKRLKQVLFNLINNAIKFTPPQGTIEIFSHKTEASWIVGVKDTGPGIEAKDQERVFGTFERGARKQGQKGAGLGLSIVKGIIELHEGKVDIVESSEKGTIIECHLPLECRSSWNIQNDTPDQDE